MCKTDQIFTHNCPDGTHVVGMVLQAGMTQETYERGLGLAESYHSHFQLTSFS